MLAHWFYKVLEENDAGALARALETDRETAKKLLKTVNQLVNIVDSIASNKKIKIALLQGITTYMYSEALHPKPRKELASTLLSSHSLS